MCEQLVTRQAQLLEVAPCCDRAATLITASSALNVLRFSGPPGGAGEVGDVDRDPSVGVPAGEPLRPSRPVLPADTLVTVAQQCAAGAIVEPMTGRAFFARCRRRQRQAAGHIALLRARPAQRFRSRLRAW